MPSSPIHLVLVALLGAGAASGCRTRLLDPAPPPWDLALPDLVATPDFATTGPVWPMFGGGPGHWFRSELPGPTARRIKWIFGTAPAPRGAQLVPRAAVGADGTVYFCSFDARLHAVDGATGRERWSWSTVGAMTSSPALAPDGTVYVLAADGTLSALDPASGQPRWSTATRKGGAPSPHPASPMVAPDGTVYLASEDGSLYALEPKGGRVKWTFATEGPLLLSPAIAADGTVYLGPSDPEGMRRQNALYAVDPTGARRWSFPLPEAVKMAPAVGADGTVYVTSPDAGVIAIDAATGSQKWIVEGYPLNVPAIGPDGTLYFTLQEERKLVAVDGQTGAIKWQGGDGICGWEATFALDAEGTLHEVGCSDDLLQVDSRTGKDLGPSFRSAVGDDHFEEFAVVGPDRTLYITSAAGNLYAIGE